MPIRVTFGKEISDADTSVPTLTEDATEAVTTISSTGRLYWRVGGVSYYVDGVSPVAAPMIGGMPMGLLMGLTYPTDTG